MHHNEPRPDHQPEVQCIKTVIKESEDTNEMMQQVTEEPGTSEDIPAADADESDAESEKGHKDICSPRVSVCLSICWAALRISDFHAQRPASCRAKTLILQVFFFVLERFRGNAHDDTREWFRFLDLMSCDDTLLLAV